MKAVEDSGRGWGHFWIFFYKNEVYKQKISIKRVRNLSKSAGNGHFRDSNFQNFLEEHDPRPAGNLVPWHSWCPFP